MTPESTQSTLCILHIAETKNAARLMRQAEYLSRHFRTTVCGLEPNPFTGELRERAAYVEMSKEPAVPKWKKVWSKFRGYVGLLGVVFPRLYGWSYRRSLRWSWCRDFLRGHRFDVVLVHDPVAAPLLTDVKECFPETKFIIDWHEYAPRQYAMGWRWKYFERPLTIQILKRFGRRADGHTTISPRFSELYHEEYGFVKPVSVLNTPMPLPEPRPEKYDDGHIHLIHHGSSSPGRELHRMVEAVGLLPEKFVLHMMLMKGFPDYIAEMKALAERVALGRVFFDEPVNYVDILTTVARCHIGVFLLPANTFNHTHSLANKLFDYLCAGLPILVSPCPDQAEMTRTNGIGWVAEDFTAESMARSLAAVTDEEIAGKVEAVKDFTSRVNAEKQHAAVVEMINRLLGHRTNGGTGL